MDDLNDRMIKDLVGNNIKLQVKLMQILAEKRTDAALFRPACRIEMVAEPPNDCPKRLVVPFGKFLRIVWGALKRCGPSLGGRSGTKSHPHFC